MKKKKRRRRLKIGRLFLLLLILGVISFAFMKFFDIKIRNIVIKGNSILTDQEIIELANLQNYPSYLEVFSYKVKKDILKSKYVKEAKVYKGLLSVNIKIKEAKVLYIDSLTNDKITMSSKINDNKIICVPVLTNSIPKKKQAEFKEAMNKINKDVLCQMSEIKYDPNSIDDDRYYVYMNDGNTVYLTVNKFKKINKYNTILENIGKQNGTLYLDYGDYFEAK